LYNERPLVARHLKIYFHEACFDGTASAALFSAFYRDVIDPHAAITTVPMQHRDGDPFAHVAIDGDDNACVDFRYSPAPAMRWWFDHHRTAFQPPSLRAHFEAENSATKFFAPDAPSCAGFIARVLGRSWAWRPPAHLAELIRWADVIDSAGFATAAAANDTANPAQRLAIWISHNRDPELAQRYIQRLATDGLELVARQPWIARPVDALVARRDEVAAVLRAKAEVTGDVVVLDLVDQEPGPSPGFLAYQLFPACAYVVSIVRGATTVKISVGKNPWAAGRDIDIGALCERHGGGGHATVGGVTLRLDEVDRARVAAASIVAELIRPDRP
jgi:hypothetical protein